ncbi:D-aminoacyl-tRNA deacylase [Candidatus Riflebacteria bacterium]
MRAVIQRVTEASVAVDNEIKEKIAKGLLIFLGVSEDDDEKDIRWLAEKICKLRIFPDANNVMNLCLRDVNGQALVISQFTLLASYKKGNRPSYIRAGKPEQANSSYLKFVAYLEGELGRPVGKGIFGAYMQISLTNDGPVTIWMDTKNKE